MMGKLHLLRYLLAVYRELPGSWKQKIKILQGLKHCILDYASDSGGITYDKLLKRFGEPKQIASNYVMEMEAEELLNSLQTRRIIAAVAMVVFVTAGIWRFTIVESYVNHKKDMAGYAIVEIIEYERIELEDDQ